MGPIRPSQQMAMQEAQPTGPSSQLVTGAHEMQQQPSESQQHDRLDNGPEVVQPVPDQQPQQGMPRQFDNGPEVAQPVPNQQPNNQAQQGTLQQVFVVVELSLMCRTAPEIATPRQAALFSTPAGSQPEAPPPAYTPRHQFPPYGTQQAPRGHFAPQPASQPGMMYTRPPGNQRPGPHGASALESLSDAPAPAQCTACGVTAPTHIEYEDGTGTYCLAAVMCLCCCLGCIPLLSNGFKDVKHYCTGCGAHLATFHRGGGQTEVHWRPAGQMVKPTAYR